MKQIYIETQIKSKHSLLIEKALMTLVNEKSTLASICQNQNMGKGPPGRTRSPGKAIALAAQIAVFSTVNEQFECEYNPSSIEKFARRKLNPSMSCNFQSIKKTKINFTQY